MNALLSHLMFSMRSPQEGREFFKRLGFVVAPLRRNAAMGDGEECPVGSQLVLFSSNHQAPGDYIKLSNLGSGDIAPFVREILSNPPTAKLMCCCSRQWENFVDSWTGLGVKMPYKFKAQSDDGMYGVSSFRIAISEFDALPVPMDVVEFESLAPYKVKEFTHHANGALFMSDVYCLLLDDGFEEACSLHAGIVKKDI